MTRILIIVILTLASGGTVPTLAGEISGSALACFPDPNYPVPRAPQCLDSTGLSMYTETGGPARDLQFRGTTFDEVGLGTSTLDLGTLTLVGAGIRSTINDTLHLSVTLVGQSGEIGTADYLVSVSGFAFYDTMRRQSVGQLTVNFGNPEPQIFMTAFGSYSLTLDVPPTPFLLTVPGGSNADGRVTYSITGTLKSIDSPGFAAYTMIATPEPGTMPLLTLATLLVSAGLFKRRRSRSGYHSRLLSW